MTTLDESYRHCRKLSQAFGASPYALTFLLPRVTRHHLHALYGFCRHAREIATPTGPVDIEDRERALVDLGERLHGDLDRGDSDDLLLKAVVHTTIAFDVNPACFRRFLDSLRTDLTVTDYETFDDLLDYMDGSAAAVAEMVLPVLEPTSGDVIAPARDLAIAIQLTQFLRDVNDDLDRQHVYLPAEDLRRFGADPRLRRVTPEWERLAEFEVARARDFHTSGDRALAMLPPVSARWVRGLRTLSLETLDRIDAARGDVFSGRVRVSRGRQALAVGRGILGR